MPTYQYHCKTCEWITDITKMIRFLDDPEYCSQCKALMDREIVPVQINTSNCQFETHFNYGLGKVVKNKNQIKDEMRRINDTTGKNIVEVGNDTLQSVKKTKKKYDPHISLGDFK